MSATNQPKEPFRVCIVGAGPVGLYLAALLLQNKDRPVAIHVLEKAPSKGTPDANAFGFGVGPRHKQLLEEPLGSHAGGRLWSRIEQTSAPMMMLRMLGRNDLCRELRTTLEELDDEKRCTLSYDTTVQSIDTDRKTVTIASSDGELPQELSYDLLVGCDGVHSRVRKHLVENHGLAEERYRRNVSWKVLNLPAQSKDTTAALGLDTTGMKRISHGSFQGAIIPRHPEGYRALLFFPVGPQNPVGVATTEDLKRALTEAVQPTASKWNVAARTLFGNHPDTSREPTKPLRLQWDDKECQRFLDSRARGEDYLKLDHYHDANAGVALVGDAAHAMYSLLGQGAACGFLTAKLLTESLREEDNVPTALATYSAKAVPEAHALTDLNLLGHALWGGILAKLLTVPVLLFNMFVRGKNLMKQLGDPSVSYRQLYSENSLLVGICRYFWRRDRLSYEPFEANSLRDKKVT